MRNVWSRHHKHCNQRWRGLLSRHGNSRSTFEGGRLIIQNAKRNHFLAVCLSAVHAEPWRIFLACRNPTDTQDQLPRLLFNVAIHCTSQTHSDLTPLHHITSKGKALKGRTRLRGSINGKHYEPYHFSRRSAAADCS